MRIAVVGAGAIGGWIAARLALSGLDVSVIARRDTLQAIDSEGLRITDKGETRCVAVATATDAAELGEHELVIVALKAPALIELAPSLGPLVGEDTLIIPMINGVPWWFTEEPLRSVDPHGAIADALPFDRIIGCVVHASCRRDAPNHVHVLHADRLILGEPSGGRSDRVSRLCGLFRNEGIRCDETDNIRREIWYKLWGNATMNPLSALTRSTADKLHDNHVIRELMADGMDELAAIGRAIDCPISETAEDRMEVTQRLGAFKSSMLQDVEAGRPIELEALLGAPREIARRLDIPTPHLDRIYAITSLMAENLGLG